MTGMRFSFSPWMIWNWSTSGGAGCKLADRPEMFTMPVHRGREWDAPSPSGNRPINMSLLILWLCLVGQLACCPLSTWWGITVPSQLKYGQCPKFKWVLCSPGTHHSIQLLWVFFLNFLHTPLPPHNLPSVNPPRCSPSQQGFETRFCNTM